MYFRLNLLEKIHSRASSGVEAPLGVKYAFNINYKEIQFVCQEIFHLSFFHMLSEDNPT